MAVFKLEAAIYFGLSFLSILQMLSSIQNNKAFKGSLMLVEYIVGKHFDFDRNIFFPCFFCVYYNTSFEGSVTTSTEPTSTVVQL